MTNKALRKVLLPALGPCPHFQEVCKEECKWSPGNGHVPRGFGGANASLDDVRLVLVTAEPADPKPEEQYGGASEAMFDQHIDFFEKMLVNGGRTPSGRSSAFHQSLLVILDLCWGDMPLSEKLRGTWFTNSVLCSAERPGGMVSPAVIGKCISTYLLPQLRLLNNAFVVALGKKAQDRLVNLGVPFHARAQSPSARPNTNPELSWRRMAGEFRNFLGE